jgi:hypothetical protein
MASVKSANVSMNTNPRIMANRIAPAAAGFRAIPSQAAAATRDWAMPQNAAAMAIEKPEAITIHMATRSGGFATSPAGACANAGSANIPNTINSKTNPASLLTVFSSVMNCRQEVAPIILKQTGSHWKHNQAGLMLLGSCHADVDRGKYRKDKRLHNRNKCV